VSFPEDIAIVEPEPMDNCHAKGEMMRDHDILRCLPLDLTKKIDGSIARMNANRVRALAEEGRKYSDAVRALRGGGRWHFGAPYGMCQEEWAELITLVEQRGGLTRCTSSKEKQLHLPLPLFSGKVTA
jgi:hypothetical protein